MEQEKTEAHQESVKAFDVLSSWQSSMSWVTWDVFKNHGNMPTILDMVDSLKILVEDRSLSIARVADGELGLMTGVKIPNSKRQHHSPSLQVALKEVLKCEKETCKIALPKWFFYRPDPSIINDPSYVGREFSKEVKKGDYFKFFKNNYDYLDACLSVPNAHYGKVGNAVISAYYEYAKKLFEGQDIILVTGDTRYAELEHRIFDEAAKTITFVKVPQVDAWNSYSDVKRLLSKINQSGERTVVLCCGATATVLAYELSDKMRCLDIGHMPIDYNRVLGGKTIGNFWH